MTIEERFWSKVEKTDGCWIWIAGIRTDGYGEFHPIRTKTVMAHRFSYELIKGNIPAGLTLDHLCRNRPCVNPDHLEPVTLTENVLRGAGIPANYARSTHCSKGHERVRGADGYRTCRECLNAWKREYYIKNKGHILKEQTRRYREKGKR